MHDIKRPLIYNHDIFLYKTSRLLPRKVYRLLILLVSPGTSPFYMLSWLVAGAFLVFGLRQTKYFSSDLTMKPSLQGQRILTEGDGSVQLTFSLM